jgi:hypothetical protein
MTTRNAQGGPKNPSPGCQNAPDDTRRDKTSTEPETEDEKIKREQATNPALMPIGDPAGAA